MRVPKNLIGNTSMSHKNPSSKKNVLMRAGENHVSLLNFLVSQYRKKSQGNLRVSKIFGWERWISRLSVEVFVSQYRKKSLETSRCFRKKSGCEIYLGCNWWFHVFRWIFFVSHYRKISSETLHFFKKFPVAKKPYGWERGKITFLCWTFCVSQHRNNSFGTLRCFK